MNDSDRDRDSRMNESGKSFNRLIHRWLFAILLVGSTTTSTAIAMTVADELIRDLTDQLTAAKGRERVEARGNLAMALDANGRVEEALKEYLRSARQREGDHWQYLLGVALTQSGQYEAAARTLRRVLKRSPGNRHAAFWLAVSEDRDGGTPAWPGDISAKAIEGVSGVNWSSLSDAERLTIHWTLETYGEDPLLDERVRYIRDDAILRDFVEQMHPVDPLSALRILSSLPGERTLADLVLMARLSLVTGHDALALQAAISGLEETPDEMSLHRIAARLYSSRGDDDLAYPHLNAIVESFEPSQPLNDEDRAVVEQLGTIELFNGHQDRSLSLFERAGTWTGAYQSGLIHGSRQNYKAAVRAFEAAIAINPQCERCFYFLGQALGEMGQFEAARRALRQSQTLRRDSGSGGQ